MCVCVCVPMPLPQPTRLDEKRESSTRRERALATLCTSNRLPHSRRMSTARTATACCTCLCVDGLLRMYWSASMNFCGTWFARPNTICTHMNGKRWQKIIQADEIGEENRRAHSLCCGTDTPLFNCYAVWHYLCANVIEAFVFSHIHTQGQGSWWFLSPKNTHRPIQISNLFRVSVNVRHFGFWFNSSWWVLPKLNRCYLNEIRISADLIGFSNFDYNFIEVTIKTEPKRWMCGW